MRLLECFSRRGLSCLLIAGAFGIAPPVIAQPILVGDVARADLQKPPFTEWFDPQYSGYQPVAETVEKLRAPLKGVSVEAYFGTWCGDSKRQVPRLLKLLDVAGFDEKRLTMVGLSDRAMEFKKSPGGAEVKRRIHRTPTFVILRDGAEIGRIVETPATSLEADLLAILSGHGPQTRYGAEAWVHELFTTRSVAEAEKALESAAPQISKRGDPDSLWHYAEFDLLRNGRAREAKAVLDLHLKLNPRSVVGLILLSEALSTMGRKDAAIETIDRALAIDPTHSRAQRAAAKIKAPNPQL